MNHFEESRKKFRRFLTERPERARELFEQLNDQEFGDASPETVLGEATFPFFLTTPVPVITSDWYRGALEHGSVLFNFPLQNHNPNWSSVFEDLSGQIDAGFFKFFWEEPPPPLEKFDSIDTIAAHKSGDSSFVTMLASQ